MMKKMVLSIAAGVMALTAGTASAQTVVSASGEGWCTNSFGCNNTNPTSINNTFAGVTGGVSYRNWFSFSLPTGSFASATLSIYNSANNYNLQPGAVYSLYAGSGISYTGLAAGGALGSVATDAADTGIDHFETIALNAAGLSALNAAAGGQFLFGGASNVMAGSDSQQFGYTNGTPVAYLTLVSGAPAVPEPASWALMIVGFGAVGGAMRSRRRSTRVAFAA